jgi:hypothetical protein
MTETVKYKSSPDVVEAKVENPENGAFGHFFDPIIQLGRILDLIIKAHILLAALLFPTAWSKTDPADPDPGLSAFYRLWCLFLGCVLLLLHIAGIFALVTRSHLIDFAKVFFVMVAWSLSLIITVVVNHENTIGTLLFALENEATQTRDESVMLIRAGQAGLRSLNKKVTGDAAKNDVLTASELFKSVGPLALMFLNKERSLLKWFMAGINLAAKGSKFAPSFFKKN